jgi:hypothetical protein
MRASETASYSDMNLLLPPVAISSVLMPLLASSIPRVRAMG